MATDKRFIDTVIEKLLPLEVMANSMFGEYGLYHQGKNFALVCDNALFVKVTAAGAALAGRVAQAPPYEGAKPAFRISSAKLNDRDWMIELVRVTCDALPLPKKKK
jgi:TfoX/Sxy family transcriptional regulator of competence genes